MRSPGAASLVAIALAGAAAQGAPAAVPSAAPGKPNASTAALLITHEFGACTSRRLNHLFASAGPGTDVFALHRAGKDVPASERPHSEAPVVAEGELPAIWELRKKVDKQVWELFGGHSKDRKQGFLAWLAASSYEYAWHIEYDIAWTGKWDNFIARYENSTADVIASTTRYNNSKDWFWWKQCPWCRENPNQATKVRWPIVRVSRRLAQSLTQGLISGKATGHHESVLGSWCAIHLENCTMHDLQKDKVIAPGGFWLGHCGPPHCRAHPPDVVRPANQLYHPLKQCEEYWIPDTGA